MISNKDLSDLIKSKQILSETCENLKVEIKKLNDQYQNSLQTIDDYKKKVGEYEQKLNEKEEHINSLNVKISALENDIKKLNETPAEEEQGKSSDTPTENTSKKKQQPNTIKNKNKSE